MTRAIKNPWCLLAACGAVTGMSGLASAQTVINISGATLFESFFTAPASTNDYLDIDGDGFARINSSNDQLAPSGPLAPGQSVGANLPWWNINYRSTGSVAGLQELIDFGSVFVTDGATGGIKALTASKAFFDRTQYISNGASSNAIFNAANPGGSPVRSNFVTLQAVAPGTVAEGIRMDLAPLDVPTTWGVQTAGAPSAARLPSQAGYGTNPRLSVTKTGTLASFPNTLAALGSRNLNIGAPDANTIFDTQVAAVPIAAFLNHGVGLTQIKQSELRHLFATGRLNTGENLVASTRESGSGTRNGFMNSIGLDPSFGVGDNVGGVGAQGSVAASESLLGPDFVPCNKIGSGDIENTVFNHRLSIGMSGAERGVQNNAWLTGGKAELLAVMGDLSGGTTYVRPTITALLHNNPATGGYVIGGIEQFASLGDPKAAPIAKGGLNNGNPAIANVEAAAYLNNITRSVAAFGGAPGGVPTLFTPGEYLASKFVLVAALDFVQNPANPVNYIPNATNGPLQTWIAANNTVFTNAAYAAYGTVSLNGKVPTRKTGVTYSDGVTGAASNYVNQGGANVAYGANVTDRNRVCGDFNGDAQRNADDALDLVKAWRQRNGGPAWVAPVGTGVIAGAPGTDAIIEVLGDFNGDGDFGQKWNGAAYVADKSDVRYWADGLAIQTSGPKNGKLDRAAGFVAVDNAFFTLTASNNFFGTTLATPKAYAAGDSRGDVAGPSGANARGWAPIGADGAVNAFDIDFVYKQFKTGRGSAVTDGEGNWDNVTEAATFDLSADINGDLKVNQADVTELVTVVLGTTLGDVNLDGVCNAADRALIQSSINTPPAPAAVSWSNGDLNGDGVVNFDDMVICSACICPTDFNADGVKDVTDIFSMLASWFGNDPRADWNHNSSFEVPDIFAFLADWFAPC